MTSINNDNGKASLMDDEEQREEHLQRPNIVNGNVATTVAADSDIASDSDSDSDSVNEERSNEEHDSAAASHDDQPIISSTSRNSTTTTATTTTTTTKVMNSTSDYSIKSSTGSGTGTNTNTNTNTNTKCIATSANRDGSVLQASKTTRATEEQTHFIYSVSSAEDSTNSSIASEKLIYSDATCNDLLSDSNHYSADNADDSSRYASESDSLSASKQQLTPTTAAFNTMNITPLRRKENSSMAKSPPPAPQAKLITLDDSGLDLSRMAFSLQPNILDNEHANAHANEHANGHERAQSIGTTIDTNADPNVTLALKLEFLDTTTSQHDDEDEEPHPNIRPAPACNPCHDVVMQNSDSTIFSLPLDALHSIATFTTVDEWRSFGITNREASLACREVFRKVKMHSFNCAIEVVTTWNRGEHADARELAALYTQCGVPIYPTPLGHSYHTLHWRMKIQSDELKATNELDEGGDTVDDHDRDAPPPSSEMRNGQVDRFYLERHEARNIGGYFLPSLTYLEEKGLFWRSKNNGIRTHLTHEQRQNSIQRFNILPPPPPLADGLGFLGYYEDDNDLPNNVEQRRVMGIGENVAIGPGNAEFGHFAGIAAMRETDANFSQFQRHSSRSEEIESINAMQPKRSRKEAKMTIPFHKHLINRHLQGKPAICDDLGNMDASPISLSSDFFHPVLSRPYPNYDERIATLRSRSMHASRRPPSRSSRRTQRPTLRSSNTSMPTAYKFVEHSVISDLELHCYDSQSGDDYDMPLHRAAFKKLKRSEFIPVLPSNEVSEIIKRCKRQLSLLLKRGDYHGFDESLLDFWDEFFPLTKYVHYYDRHTPIIRMSKMHTFLTKPCPKAFGTMQCEIERVKVKYRTKGMSAGRYYHTYEYRLFIRDRRKPNYDGTIVEELYPRMDTVLMTAKYRGKHYSGPSGLTPVPNGKRGVNHYFLYMPQQSDIDEHYKCVNKDVVLTNVNIYKQDVPASGSILELSRLQTNYMGTEFQITSPRPLRGENSVGDLEREEVQIESVPSSEIQPSQAQVPIEKKSRLHFGFQKRKKKSKHDKTTSKKPNARITPFSFKKNVANLSSKSLIHPSAEANMVPVEEKEIGAITYTANVLGNRPRIMNVSIPNICDDTEMPFATDDTWTKGPGEESTMLSLLKALQLRRNSDANDIVNEDETSEDNFGLASLQNRPPWWNVDLAAFVLNFGGRVSVASVKNFQLCDREDHENIMLQFGRIEGRHSFTMDFSYPLSPVQAFAISISSLQSKISFA